jgi:hypothetical protein
MSEETREQAIKRLAEDNKVDIATATEWYDAEYPRIGGKSWFE